MIEIGFKKMAIKVPRLHREQFFSQHQQALQQALK